MEFHIMERNEWGDISEVEGWSSDEFDNIIDGLKYACKAVNDYTVWSAHLVGDEMDFGLYWCEID